MLRDDEFSRREMAVLGSSGEFFPGFLGERIEEGDALEERDLYREFLISGIGGVRRGEARIHSICLLDKVLKVKTEYRIRWENMCRAMRVGVNVRHSVKPDLNLPPDFQDFWQETLADLNAVDPAAETIDVEHDHPGELDLQELRFNSLGGARVTGYLLTAPGPRPLVVHSHGYGSQCDVRWDWAESGVNVLGVDIRGFGRSVKAAGRVSRAGYVLTGIGSPETSILRSAVCDYIRAVQVGRDLLGRQTTRLVAHGISFAGGLALMAEAVLQTVDVLVVGVPTFGWAEGRHFFVKLGSGAEISDYLAARPGSATDVALVLGYFDSMNFAPDVRCPTLVGLGLSDDVVPAKTVFAIANHLGGPHELMEFPVSHSEHPDERLWEDFDARCIDLALHGPAVGFGSMS